MEVRKQSEIPISPSTPGTAFDDFMHQGFVLLPSILDSSTITSLRKVIDDNDNKKKTKTKKKQKVKHTVYRCVFEDHPELCLRVFKNETILSIVKQLLGCCGSARGKEDSSLTTHVIHNNAYRIDPGSKGQASNWHTDDSPTFQTTDGKPLPINVIVSPLVLTCMYFLNGINTPGDGGTRVIENSHRFGELCSNDTSSKYQQLYTKCPTGSVLTLSSHTWHRGSAIESGCNPRYVFQVTYGRRLVGHKHGSVMNYNLPTRIEKVLETEEDRKLMGFLQGGAYS